MSKMIPAKSVASLRKAVDVTIDNYGIDIDLYLASNPQEMLEDGIYAVPDELETKHFTTMAWIEWSPDIRRLRQLGWFSEETTPILTRFLSYGTNDQGEEENIDVIIGSYFKVNPKYIPSNYQGEDEFEVVDILIGEVHDSMISRVYHVVPRRHRV